MPQAATVSKLAQVAEEQWGLVTRRQAEKAGVSPATLQRLSDKGVLERVGHGVYHLAGAPLPDQVPLRAAWLQLAPDTPAWERKSGQGVVSHRSAAALYGLGHLPADTHEFTLPARRQVRRPDMRVHRRKLADDEWVALRGLPVTRPSRIASDLLADREEPEAVAHVVADAIRKKNEYAAVFVGALAPHAARLGLRRRDGLAVLRWLL
ncbi:MAG TPA: type IV toxin-antitoxin system AbiEi family antitoxin domain-containing protein, partial [Solirubrobacterales bacterium]|nr:type IV toxin-antitoxin system AbiEi family antitoxin domain-containing protein [Solirubrobacterales bacterium]